MPSRNTKLISATGGDSRIYRGKRYYYNHKFANKRDAEAYAERARKNGKPSHITKATRKWPKRRKETLYLVWTQNI